MSVNAERVGSEILDKGGNVNVSSWSWYLNTDVAKTSVTSFAVYGAKSCWNLQAGLLHYSNCRIGGECNPADTNISGHDHCLIYRYAECQ